LWREHFHWSVLLNWVVLAVTIPIILAVAAILLVFDQYGLANRCFVITALFIFAKIIQVAVISQDAAWQRLLFTFLLFGVFGIAIVETVRGVNKWAAKRSKPTQESSQPREAVEGTPGVTPKPSASPSSEAHGTTDEVRAKPPELTRKIPPPRSAPAEPSAKGPTRLGIGPEAYKDIEDGQVGQWAMEEADKIYELAKAVETKSVQGWSADAVVWFFTNQFNQCCVQDLKELRTEILRRLGPPGKDPDEITAWTALFITSNKINPMSVTSYAPHLWRLGLRLKRRENPRAKPRPLSFSETNVPPDQRNIPNNIVVTIKTDKELSSGYIVVEFEGRFVRVSCDFVDSKLVLGDMVDRDFRPIDNAELKDYLKSHTSSTYALAIGKTPFSPEKPVQVFASGAVPLHVAKVTLFDE
jgi:hypothetical protein